MKLKALVAGGLMLAAMALPLLGSTSASAATYADCANAFRAMNDRRLPEPARHNAMVYWIYNCG